MKPLNCSTCRFWQATTDYGRGDCRRYAPRATDEDTPIWVETDEKDWCGEHEIDSAKKGQRK